MQFQIMPEILIGLALADFGEFLTVPFKSCFRRSQSPIQKEGSEQHKQFFWARSKRESENCAPMIARITMVSQFTEKSD
jgi:hypothetical protein